LIRRAAVSIPVAATREAVWALLTDLEHSAAWLPGIDRSRVLTREGDISVVEVDIAGRPMALEVVESPPEGARFEQVDRSGRGGVSGRWSLREDGDRGLVVDAEIRVPALLFDLGAGRRLRDAVNRAAAVVTDQLRRPPTARLATYRRALAIVRRDDVIEAHIGDEVVELFRIGGGE
jgi:carbon monoxide dehydrogenase subunit G